MPDSGSHHHSAPRPPHHRPPPLVVIAAAGLAVVLGLGITLVILRALGDRGKSDKTAAISPSEPDAPSVPPTPAPSRDPARAETPAHAAAPATAAESPPAEVPEWERKPLRTSQPFPEEARIDPPTPPIKIPPEMLVPPVAPDAAGAR